MARQSFTVARPWAVVLLIVLASKACNGTRVPEELNFGIGECMLLIWMQCASGININHLFLCICDTVERKVRLSLPAGQPQCAL
jgi:hypothetical protein